jgi:hypothetical protein
MELKVSLQLINREKFVQRVIENSRETTTYREAYENVESEFFLTFGQRRFSSYESFRVAKHRVQKITLQVNRNVTSQS